MVGFGARGDVYDVSIVESCLLLLLSFVALRFPVWDDVDKNNTYMFMYVLVCDGGEKRHRVCMRVRGRTTRVVNAIPMKPL